MSGAEARGEPKVVGIEIMKISAGLTGFIGSSNVTCGYG
jgi:hypothetical protein